MPPSTRPSRAPNSQSLRPSFKKASRPVPARKKRVLVVEDDHDVRRLVVRTLSVHWDVTEAADGMAALCAIESDPPDLVICDVMLPKVDGFTAFERLKRSNRFARIPFVFVTARDGSRDAARGVALGARYYIPKPFTLVELVEKVARALGEPIAPGAALKR